MQTEDGKNAQKCTETEKWDTTGIRGKEWLVASEKGRMDINGRLFSTSSYVKTDANNSII